MDGVFAEIMRESGILEISFVVVNFFPVIERSITVYYKRFSILKDNKYYQQSFTENYSKT